MGIPFAAIVRAIIAAFGRRRPSAPQPTSSPFTLRTVAVTVASTDPIPGATVALQSTTTPALFKAEGVTNADGYFAFSVPTSVTTVTLTITAARYTPYLVMTDVPPYNVDLCVGVSAGGGRAVVLPGLELARRRGRRGIATLSGRSFMDEDGFNLPIGVSLFWAFWAYQHDRHKLTAHLDWLADHRVDYIRVFGVIGPRWADRQIDPRSSDWDRALGEFLDIVHAHGLRVEFTIWQDTDFTPTPTDREALVDRVASVVIARPQTVQYLEICNEGYADTSRFPADWSTEAQRLASRLRALVPHAVAVTSPAGVIPASIDQWYGHTTANLLTIHLPREVVGGGPIGEWRYVRQTWDPWLASPRAWTNDEGKGPQSSVSADDDPLRLTMYAGLTWLCGGAGFVLHTGAGVSGAGERERAVNLWGVPQIEATLRGIAATRDLLPPDLPNWTRHNANSRFPQYPFDLNGVNAGDDGNSLRAFAATHDGRVVCMPILITREALFAPKTPLHTDVYDPLTGMLEASYDGSFRVTPRGAALLIGRPI